MLNYIIVVFLSPLSGFFCSLQSLCGSLFRFYFFLCIIALFVYDQCVCRVVLPINITSTRWCESVACLRQSRAHEGIAAINPHSTRLDPKTELNWTEQNKATQLETYSSSKGREWETEESSKQKSEVHWARVVISRSQSRIRLVLSRV